MGKKTLKLLPSIFRPKFIPSCGHSKTISFRCGTTGNDEIFKTVNSVFFDPVSESVVETPKSWFTTSSESASFSTESEDIFCYNNDESLDMLVRGARSERLFFEPGDTSSILEKAKASGFPFKESVVLAMESDDPYEDFKRSMEEMVESHGVKDWENLEELLSWYLRVNGKNNHGFIVGAFVDLLISIAASNSNSCSDNSTSYSSAVSSFASSPLLSLSEAQNEITEHEAEDDTVTSN